MAANRTRWFLIHPSQSVSAAGRASRNRSVVTTATAEILPDVFPSRSIGIGFLILHGPHLLGSIDETKIVDAGLSSSRLIELNLMEIEKNGESDQYRKKHDKIQYRAKFHIRSNTARLVRLRGCCKTCSQMEHAGATQAGGSVGEAAGVSAGGSGAGVSAGCVAAATSSATESKSGLVGAASEGPDAGSAAISAVGVAAVSPVAEDSAVGAASAAGDAVTFFSGFGGLGAGFLAVSNRPSANSITCP